MMTMPLDEDAAEAAAAALSSVESEIAVLLTQFACTCVKWNTVEHTWPREGEGHCKRER